MRYPNLYPPQANSPATTLSEAVFANATQILVEDASILPEAPNLLVIGGPEEDAETVLMTAKNGNTLTVQRGIELAAREWAAQTAVARNFTASDLAALQEWVQNIVAEKGEANGIAPLNNKRQLNPSFLPPLGMGVDLLGMYATLEELTEARPEGRVRDAWLVGTPQDNTLYVWDKDAQEWKNAGSMATSVNGLTGNINLIAEDIPYTNPAMETVENVRQGLDEVSGKADSIAVYIADTRQVLSNLAAVDVKYMNALLPDIANVGAGLSAILAMRGAANGVAPLGVDGRIPPQYFCTPIAWTPHLEGYIGGVDVTYTSNFGKIMQIGKLVFIEAFMVIDTITGYSDAMVIYLPILPDLTQAVSKGASIGRICNITRPKGSQITLEIAGDRLEPRSMTEDGVMGNLGHSRFSHGSTLSFTAIYMTA